MLLLCDRLSYSRMKRIVKIELSDFLKKYSVNKKYIESILRRDGLRTVLEKNVLVYVAISRTCKT